MGKIENEVADKGGRRMGIDRRQVDIEGGVDNERRANPERRKGRDRRDNYSYKKEPTERRESFSTK